MKIIKSLFFTCLLVITFNTQAQTADEIINNYFENTGGKANWEKLQAVKMTGILNQQGMEIPIEMYQLKGGKSAVIVNFQGKSLKFNVFDGENLWGTNFMTQKAEKSDKESTDNYKKNSILDFPSPFLSYKEKGYSIESLGKDTKEGTECFKIKLTQNPIMIDGKEEVNSTIYYFDTENFVPIAQDNVAMQGPMKGQTITSSMSDYEEVEGLYFPFSINGAGQPITIKSIEINPTVEDSLFKMPEDATVATPASKN